MDIQELNKLYSNAYENLSLIGEAIKILTQNNPLVLFDEVVGDVVAENNDISEDDLYEQPFGYVVDDYFYYEEAAIKKVEGSKVTLFLRGESWGSIETVDISEIPFQSQVELLGIILERME